MKYYMIFFELEPAGTTPAIFGRDNRRMQKLSRAKRPQLRNNQPNLAPSPVPDASPKQDLAPTNYTL